MSLGPDETNNENFRSNSQNNYDEEVAGPAIATSDGTAADVAEATDAAAAAAAAEQLQENEALRWENSLLWNLINQADTEVESQLAEMQKCSLSDQQTYQKHDLHLQALGMDLATEEAKLNQLLDEEEEDEMKGVEKRLQRIEMCLDTTSSMEEMDEPGVDPSNKEARDKEIQQCEHHIQALMEQMKQRQESLDQANNNMKLGSLQKNKLERMLEFKETQQATRAAQSLELQQLRQAVDFSNKKIQDLTAHIARINFVPHVDTLDHRPPPSHGLRRRSQSYSGVPLHTFQLEHNGPDHHRSKSPPERTSARMQQRIVALQKKRIIEQDVVIRKYEAQFKHFKEENLSLVASNRVLEKAKSSRDSEIQSMRAELSATKKLLSELSLEEAQSRSAKQGEIDKNLRRMMQGEDFFDPMSTRHMRSAGPSLEVGPERHPSESPRASGSPRESPRASGRGGGGAVPQLPRVCAAGPQHPRSGLSLNCAAGPPTRYGNYGSAAGPPHSNAPSHGNALSLANYAAGPPPRYGLSLANLKQAARLVGKCVVTQAMVVASLDIDVSLRVELEDLFLDFDRGAYDAVVDAVDDTADSGNGEHSERLGQAIAERVTVIEDFFQALDKKLEGTRQEAHEQQLQTDMWKQRCVLQAQALESLI